MSSSTTLVRVTCVSPGTEPIVFYRDVLREQGFPNTLKEIEMVRGELYGGMYELTSAMYCFMDSLASAQDMVTKLTGKKYGLPHAYCEMVPKIVAMTEAPGEAALKRLTDFFCAEKAMPRTKTVRFSQLPPNHVIPTVNTLVENSTFANCADDYEDPPEQLSALDLIESEHAEGNDRALVRFVSIYAAENIVAQYNGTYWKNNTIYAWCVEDKELDSLLEAKNQSKSANATAKLFIGAVKPGATTEDIRQMFAPHVPKDVTIPPGKNFAFVFMHDEAAAKFMAANRNGKKYGGWTYRVKYANDKNKGKAKRGISAPSDEFKATPASGPASTETYGGYTKPFAAPKAPTKPTPSDTPAQAIVSETIPQGPAKVRVNGLAYAATEQHIRKLFDDAKFSVLDIVLNNSIAKDIHAIVKLPSYTDAERAISTLNKKKILKRPITVVNA